MKKIIFAFLALVLAAFPASAEEPRVMEFDVAVIGAGCGGSAAAIQAARLGMEVAVVEESDWVGGQMTGGGVSTMDDVRRTRTGIYGEFLRRASAYYEARETPVNTCYWGSDTFAFEPWVIQRTLLDMMREAGEISLFMETRVLEAKMKDGAVRAAVVERGGERIELRAKVFIDATEAGDFIPLTGARYRAGHGDSSGELDGVIQDITYVAVIRRYPEGVPEELRFTRRRPGYEEYAPRFREIIALGRRQLARRSAFQSERIQGLQGHARHFQPREHADRRRARGDVAADYAQRRELGERLPAREGRPRTACRSAISRTRTTAGRWSARLWRRRSASYSICRTSSA